MEPEPPMQLRCDACVWWVAATDGHGGRCPYRAAATSSNTAWKQIVLGRCSHYLPTAPQPEADGGEVETT